MYVCILHQAGEILVHQHMQASPDTWLRTMAPYRDDIVVAVEGLFTWYWRADLWAQEGLPVVLGPALYMNAIHGGNANHDTIDAQNIAGLRRGGMLPQACVSPAAMRATRDLLRRRMHCMRTRAELLTHVPHTKSQDHRPEMGRKIADKTNRDGVAERLADPAVHKSIAVDLALIGHDDELLRDVERSILTAATPHDANTRYLRRTVPGIGAILSLVLRYALHEIQRFPRVQEFVSDGRLVTCATASAGKRDGTSGTTIGHASRTWACSAAAVRFRRANPAGQQDRGRLANTHGQGKALTVLAHTRARAVYDLVKRDTAFERHTCLTSERERSGRAGRLTGH